MHPVNTLLTLCILETSKIGEDSDEMQYLHCLLTLKQNTS